MHRNEYSSREGPPENDGSPTEKLGTIESRTLTDLPDLLQDLLKKGYAQDAWLRDANSQASSRLSVNSSGLFLQGDKVYVPNDMIVKRLIMQELHDSKYGGHFGITKTRKLVERIFWWPKMRAEIEHHVRTCTVCLQNKALNMKPAGLLQPLPVPARPWDSVSFDFIVKLPLTKAGHDAIVVFIDRLTKMVHFAPTTTTCSAEGFARLYYDYVYR
jgi:hypothetical protein